MNRVSRVIDRLKWAAEKYFLHNFFLYFCAKRIFHVFPLLLPHEKDYYGLKLLLSESDGLFLDIGANDGVSALSFRKINGSYSILSFEPNPMHFGSLERVKRKLKKFDYRLCAVGDSPGILTLKMPTYRGIPLHSAAFCLPEQQRILEALFPDRVVKRIRYLDRQVPVIRLDDLQLSPAVVKIDAEGYDLKVVRGMADTIRRCRPVLMIENNPGTIHEMTEVLSGYGYSVYTYDHDTGRFEAYSGSRTRNVFFTMSDPCPRGQV